MKVLEFNDSKTAIIIQARLQSTRLPKKVLLNVSGSTLIEHLICRLLPLNIPIILTIPQGELESFSFLNKYSLFFFEGSEDNVLSRYIGAAQYYGVKNIIRVTSDNPLTSEKMLFYGLEHFLKEKVDLVYIENIPHGSGVEFTTLSSLLKILEYSPNSSHLEHVTLFMREVSHKFHIKKLPPLRGYHSNLRVTVDTQEDFDQYCQWIEELGLEKEGFLSLEKVLSRI